MSYLEFLVQWYNWPYLAGLACVIVSLAYRPFLSGLGSRAGSVLGLERTPGHSVLRTFGTILSIVGLTINGALHDYWPRTQEEGFLPGFVLTMIVAVYATRRIGRFREKTFPPIKAIGLGSSDLSGMEGQVVSRSVGPEYRAGRAQVMDSEETLHIVMCKTSVEEIPYGAKVILGEYDPADRRYFVRRVDVKDDEKEGASVELEN